MIQVNKKCMTSWQYKTYLIWLWAAQRRAALMISLTWAHKGKPCIAFHVAKSVLKQRCTKLLPTTVVGLVGPPLPEGTPNPRRVRPGVPGEADPRGVSDVEGSPLVLFFVLDHGEVGVVSTAVGLGRLPCFVQVDVMEGFISRRS